MLKEREIRDQVAGYLARQIDLGALSSWLYGAAWDMGSDVHPATRALAHAVLSRLDEYSSSGFSEDVLRGELDSLAKIIVQMEVENQVQAESSAQMLEVPVSL
jgi:hypothetical protein